MSDLHKTGQGLKQLNAGNKFLTFTLAAAGYGIGILKVKEIIGIMPITAVPRTPDYVKGVINLRGKVIPVVDLRLKFGMEELPHNERTCIIVMEIETPSGPFALGAVVDSVSEVMSIRDSEMEDSPNFGIEVNTDYILGMAKTNGSLKILLDIDKVLGDAGAQF
jgi:purine-binding chemotaxis protein CheW